MTRRVLAATLVCLALWCFADFVRHPGDPKKFDGEAVGRLEAKMWRSYYDQDRLVLFLDLAQNLREQFHVPFWQSYVAAFNAARAAFVFQQGKQRSDYERALPDLERYYKRVLPAGDAKRLAKIELEWWIIHRERAQYPQGALQRSLTELASAVYGLPPEVLGEHSELRTRAMLIRDAQAGQGALTEADWNRIEELLVQSWSSLRRALGD